jgi:hypothetical protein
MGVGYYVHEKVCGFAGKVPITKDFLGSGIKA